MAAPNSANDETSIDMESCSKNEAETKSNPSSSSLKPPPASSVLSETTTTLKPPPASSVLSETTTTPQTTVDVAAVAADPVSEAPTYQSSKASKHYTIARTLLSDQEFEEALTTISEGIELTLAALPDEDDSHWHDALAPFNYLYGTTLLYSIEESNDPNQQMTQSAEPAAAPEGEEEAPPDDLEISWENLETARTIIHRMIESDPTSIELQTDLAQIHLRIADLERLNGRNEEAIADYATSLKYREATEPTKWSRKIAELHYNLGLVYFVLLAKMNASKTEESSPGGDEQEPNVPDAAAVAEKRSKGFEHYYLCARTFGGIIAELCGSDPDQLVESAEAKIASLKRTGEEDEDDNEDSPKVKSLKVASLREVISEQDVHDDVKDEVGDLKSILDEIQETIDEAESAELGIREVTAMKEQITAAVAAQGEEEEEQSSNGFGTASAAASTASAQPLMVVKKKKRPSEATGASSGDPAAKKIKSVTE